MNVWPTAPVAPSTATGDAALRRRRRVMRRAPRATMRSYASTARAQLLDVDVLVGGVRDVDRARPEEQRRSPAAEQRNVRRVRHGRDLEAVDGVEALRGNVRAPLELRRALRPTSSIASRTGCDVADEPEHHLRLAERGNDVRLGAAANRADVHRRVAEHRVGGQRQRRRRWAAARASARWPRRRAARTRSARRGRACAR